MTRENPEITSEIDVVEMVINGKPVETKVDITFYYDTGWYKDQASMTVKQAKLLLEQLNERVRDL